MKTVKKILLENYPLLLILFVGGTLRVHLAFVRGSLWFDELFSIHFSSLPWHDALRYWALETNPPLYMIFLRYYLPFINQNKEFLIRLPSLFFGLSSILLLYFWAKRMFNKPTALIAALFLALSNIHMFQSTEIRTYSLSVLLTIVSSFLFYLYVFEKKTKLNFLILLTVVNVLWLYSHLTILPIFLGQFIVICVSKMDAVQKKKWFIANGIAVILFMVWFTSFLITKANGNIASSWYFNADQYKNQNILNLVLSGFISEQDFFILTILSVLLIGLIAIFFYDLLKNKERSNEKKSLLTFLSLSAFVPVLTTSLLGVYIPKYLLVSYPALHCIIAYTIQRLFPKPRQNKFIMAAILILLLPSALYSSTLEMYFWDKTAQYIEKNETNKSISLVAFPEILSVNKYYHGKRPVVSIYLKNDNLPLEEQIVKNNWHLQDTTPKKVGEWLQKQIDIYNPDKIFFVGNIAGYSWATEYFLNQGWIPKQINVQTGLNVDAPIEFYAPINNCSTSTKNVQ